MRATITFVLTVAGLASLASCDSKFIQPPASNSKQPSDTDMTKNKRYNVGDKIQIEYETDLNQPAVEINQLPRNGVSSYRSLPRNGSANPTYWVAEYDYLGLANDPEDSVYWFDLFKFSNGKVARSEYFNASSPKSDETTSASLPVASTSGQQESTSTTGSASETHTGTTTTGSSASGKTNSSSSSNSGSGLSTGATAGITAGAIIGGLLILGGIGWFVWRRLGKGKKNSNGPEGAQEQQHQFYPLETKAELPNDITTHPSEYATSRPEIHEAPQLGKRRGELMKNTDSYS